MQNDKLGAGKGYFIQGEVIKNDHSKGGDKQRSGEWGAMRVKCYGNIFPEISE